MAPKLDPFAPGTLERISRVIGAAFTGQVISRMLATTGLNDPIDLSTKWRRIYAALATAQDGSGSGTRVVTFIKEAASPSNSSGDAEAHERLVQALNVPSALAGYKLMLDGRMFQAPKASTVSEAQRRADRMRDELDRRRVHPDVIRFCRAELVAKDYFHAVFEAAKSVADKLRSITGLTSDAVTLVQTAFERGGSGPYLLVNDLKDPSDWDDHDGVAAIMRGIFKVFRNVPAHLPRVYSTITEQDAMDLLTTVSYLHRRLDMAIPTARAKPRP
ncbi:MAG: TIGR02391 family protein [Chloroflexota bacterium]